MGEQTANITSLLDENLFAAAPSRIGPPQPWPREGETSTAAAATPAAGAALFPIFPTEPRGLARLAGEAVPVDEGHLVTFRSLPVRSILNKSVSKRRLWFARTINPYRGCEFGCKYCYARYTHEFLEKDHDSFEREIYIKQNAAWLLEQELRELAPGEEIAIGTATDPYQPIERRARVTRSLLEVLAKRQGHRIGIVTKSTLILRDIDLLQRIARSNELVLHMTITTADTELARLLEPRAPRPDLRFAAVKRLRQAGLRVGVLCSPLLPGLTDNGPALEAVASRAKAADASFFAAQPLFLKPCSRPTFLAFLREHYPGLEASYAERYESDAFVSKAYATRIRDLVRSVARRHGLSERTMDAILTRDAGPSVPIEAPRQSTLFPVANGPGPRRQPTPTQHSPAATAAVV